MNDSDTLTVMRIRLERERDYSRKLRDDLDERDRMIVVLSNDATRAENHALAVDAEIRSVREAKNVALAEVKKREAEAAQAQLDAENLKVDLHNARLQIDALKFRLRTRAGKGRRR